MSALRRFRIRAAARLREGAASAPVSETAAWWLALASAIPGVPARHRGALLLAACRRARGRALRRFLRRRLAPRLRGEAAEAWRRDRIGWGRYYGAFGDLRAERALTTTLVLKAPGEGGEKGVLYSSFEYNWMRLLAHHDARAVLGEYVLVGATSWSPPDFAPLAALAGLSEDPVFVGISHPADVEALALARPVVEPVPILAGDWVDPDAYAPRPHAERTIDLLMVAHWAPFKRHWLLWEALRRMRRDLRVVLVGEEQPGRGNAELLAEARAFGVRQELELVVSVPHERVAELQCDARACVLLSAREGSCVAVAESLFAGAPVAMMEGAHVGATAYLNPATGSFLPRRGIGRALERFIEASGARDPRGWALRNIGCHHASRRLNRILRDHAHRTGRPWTRDIEPLCWRYVPDYVDPAGYARMAPAVEALHRRHAVRLVALRAPDDAAEAAAAPAGG